MNKIAFFVLLQIKVEFKTKFVVFSAFVQYVRYVGQYSKIDGVIFHHPL
ncbi:hypothetical protein ACFFF5_06650 [Lederbergia wuyishanensis]|uniref:Uncharacterized protein n=1 Tax=Lederbergia wuyishanensis TaxID=1347903 RepID=A0ABU0D2R8_9BACI|nr:hypothetical protein [Lederbergia wuyishanensis]MCJ8007170.1 hypothetical protein [Lederbergia wuyishanensis]MDQ0342685.1 hypothetical protein [Lederbergia wuyishanensis]